MNRVESFELDHRRVKAPYIRKCSCLEGPNGDKVTKYDLRFKNPNKECIDTASLHALEHFLAGFLRERLNNIIDISPMGCRTGFYLSAFGEIDREEIKKVLEYSLLKVIEAKEVPAANDLQCGNYKDLSLSGARKCAEEVLTKGFSLNVYGE